MKPVMSFSVLAASIAISGCATIVQGTTQSVSITTEPADGAKCELRNSEGVWYLMSPGSAVVHKTKNDLAVTCKKDGYDDATLTVPSKFGATTAGNIIAGGIIGIGIDAASGANYHYSPSTAVQMKPRSAVIGNSVEAPSIAATAIPPIM